MKILLTVNFHLNNFQKSNHLSIFFFNFVDIIDF